MGGRGGSEVGIVVVAPVMSSAVAGRVLGNRNVEGRRNQVPFLCFQKFNRNESRTAVYVDVRSYDALSASSAAPASTACLLLLPLALLLLLLLLLTSAAAASAAAAAAAAASTAALLLLVGPARCLFCSLPTLLRKL